MIQHHTFSVTFYCDAGCNSAFDLHYTPGVEMWTLFTHMDFAAWLEITCWCNAHFLLPGYGRPAWNFFPNDLLVPLFLTIFHPRHLPASSVPTWAKVLCMWWSSLVWLYYCYICTMIIIDFSMVEGDWWFWAPSYLTFHFELWSLASRTYVRI